MMSLIARLRHDERGASATEYAMLIVFVALAIAAGAQTFGKGLSTWFATTAGTIAALNTNVPPAQ